MEKISKLIDVIKERWREVSSDCQQMVDGYSHVRSDDSGDEPDHTDYGSNEWREWELRRGFR